MNPLRWFRWKVVIALVVIFGALWLIGVDPFAHQRVNELGRKSERARWEIGGLDLGILGADLRLADLLVAQPERDGGPAGAAAPAGKGAAGAAAEALDQVFSAISARFDLSVNNVLRRRFVVDELAIDTPKLRVERRPDGSTNIGDIAAGPEEAEEPEPPPEERRPRDWVETARKWFERIRKVQRRLPGRDGEPTPEEAPEEEVDDLWELAAQYPFAGRPGFLVRRVVAKGLEITFVEQDPEGPPLPAFTGGELSLEELSNRPSVHENPVRLALTGKLAGADLLLEANLDFARETPRYTLDFRVAELPASAVAAFVGPSLPVELAGGTVSVEAAVGLDGDGSLRVDPLLAFRGMRLAPKPGEDRVAGLPAGEFVGAFNQASEALGDAPLTIADLRIRGTLSPFRPEFIWGDTVKNLVVEGGKAFARKQLSRLESGVRGVVGEETERLREKAAEALEGSPIGEGLRGSIPGLDGSKDAGDGTGKDAGEPEGGDSTSGTDAGTGDAAEDAVRGATDRALRGVRGILGGSSEEPEPEGDGTREEGDGSGEN